MNGNWVLWVYPKPWRIQHEHKFMHVIKDVPVTPKDIYDNFKIAFDCRVDYELHDPAGLCESIAKVTQALRDLDPVSYKVATYNMKENYTVLPFAPLCLLLAAVFWGWQNPLLCLAIVIGCLATYHILNRHNMRKSGYVEQDPTLLYPNRVLYFLFAILGALLSMAGIVEVACNSAVSLSGLVLALFTLCLHWQSAGKRPYYIPLAAVLACGSCLPALGESTLWHSESHPAITLVLFGILVGFASAIEPLLLNKPVSGPAQYKVMAALAACICTDVPVLQDATSLETNSLLEQLNQLVQAGYVDIRTATVKKRPRILASLTPEGRQRWKTERNTTTGDGESVRSGTA